MVRPEDAEIFANVACLVNLPDSPVATLMESQVLTVDDEHDPTLPHGLKIQRALEKNVALRASTSLDSIQSYESFCN